MAKTALIWLFPLSLSLAACSEDSAPTDEDRGNAQGDDDGEDDSSDDDDDSTSSSGKKDAGGSSGGAKADAGSTGSKADAGAKADTGTMPSDAGGKVDNGAKGDAGGTTADSGAKTDAGTEPSGTLLPKCVQKDSQVIIVGDSYINWLSHSFPDVLQELSGQAWRMEAVGGSSIASGGLTGFIPDQFRASIAADPDAHTVLMDGGGNDILLADPALDPLGQCTSTGASENMG